jgi:hypothetical protein
VSREHATLFHKAASEKGKAGGHTTSVHVRNKVRKSSVQFAFGEKTSRNPSHTASCFMSMC